MQRLILVRHGQTESNVLGLLDTGVPGAPLTELGLDQAAELVRTLADEPIQRIVVSNLLRTRQTATPLADARGLEPVVDAGLREIEAGDLELRGDPDAHRAYLGTVFAWARGETTATMPGGVEDAHGFLGRFDAAVEAAMSGADTVVIVSHGASIRTWATVRAANLDMAYGGAHGLPNTGIVILERAVNDAAAQPWQAVAWDADRFADPDADPTGAPLAE